LGVLLSLNVYFRGLQGILEGHFLSSFQEEGGLLLKIKKSHFDESYIVYNPHDFTQHTHIQQRGIAFVVKRNVERNLLPKTNNSWLLHSHIRVSTNSDYIAMVQAKIDSLK